MVEDGSRVRVARVPGKWSLGVQTGGIRSSGLQMGENVKKVTSQPNA